MLVQNRYLWDGIWENSCQIHSRYSWIPLRTEFHLKQSTLKFSDQVSQNRYLEDEI